MPWSWDLPASASAYAIGHVSQAATLVQTAPETSATDRWRVFGSYALVYVSRGSGWYEDKTGLNCQVKAGDLIRVTPSLAHRYRPGVSGWVQTFLVFDGPFVPLWRDLEPFADASAVRSLGRDDWPRRFRWVVDGAPETEPDHDPLRQVCRLQTLLAELQHSLLRCNRSASPLRSPAWLPFARERLADALHLPLDLEVLARDCHVSYSTFRRDFTRYIGMTPARYRAGQTIDRARHLMQRTTKTDKEIATELGFSSAQHFSRRFKQVVGRTATQYRESLR